ncbi:MAG: class I SAM-dependent methyltransferase [bacterium]|nr:class I SAM-dependent methyltransferase [bacterium]
MISKNLKFIAERYNYDPNHNLRYQILKEIVEFYRIQELLILGCGIGVLEFILSDSVRCISVDIDPYKLYIAQEINSAKKNRTFIQSDIYEIKQKLKKKFPAILISEVLEHLEDDKSCIRVVKNLLKLNGLFILTVPNINRLTNKIRRYYGRKIQFMSNEHKKEYTYQQIIELLSVNGSRSFKKSLFTFDFPKRK